MDRICQTVYEPLFTFCKPLHEAFPEQLDGYDVFMKSRETSDWGTIVTIGPGCTKQLLVAALSKNDKQFYSDITNPFVKFLGGKVVYDRLLEKERETFWKDDRIADIIRQCMVLYALHPMTDKLKCIVDKVTNLSGGKKLSQQDIIKSLLSDPQMIMSMMSLVDSPDGMKSLMSGLKTIIGGMMTTAADAVPVADADVDADADEDVIDTNIDISPISAVDNPSAFIRRETRKKKRRHRKKRNATTANPIIDMVNELEMDDDTIKTMTEEIQSMNAGDMSTIVQEVTSMLGTASGDGASDTLQNIMGGLLNGTSDISSLLNASGGLPGDIGTLLSSLKVSTDED
jgi:hypothetical protein